MSDDDARVSHGTLTRLQTLELVRLHAEGSGGLQAVRLIARLGLTMQE
jgi:hypothetical protein